MERMKFGVAFANIGPFVEPVEAVRLAQAAEAAGFESIWTVDHVVVPAGYQSTYPYDPSGKLPSGEETVFPDPLDLVGLCGRLDLDPAAGHRHPHRAAPQPAGAGQGAGHSGLPVGGPHDPRGAGSAGWRRSSSLGDSVCRAWARAPRRPSPPCGPCGPRSRPASTARRPASANCCLRPQPRRGSIPVHVGGHSPAAARRAGRIGDGFFPFGVGPDELPGPARLMPAQRRGSRAGIRRPLRSPCSATPPPAEEALAEVRPLQELGATRVVVPAVLFGADSSRHWPATART